MANLVAFWHLQGIHQFWTIVDMEWVRWGGWWQQIEKTGWMTQWQTEFNYDVRKYPQWASIPLQSRNWWLVTAVSSPPPQFRSLHWYHFISHQFTWLAKRRPVDINQYRWWACIVAINWGNKMNFMFVC